MKVSKFFLSLILLLSLTSSCVDSVDETEALYDQGQQAIERDEIKETDV
ncbi:hypothetical protein [Abyssalbus ytuae]|uniref:Secreted protein n=1 Tax=Abyssalbus ytuae TaxID=2926907 RepID=A0A9E6ZUP2_9FLAO|nr:hypothetical protein [Abyssalbus ytuae]UOB19263.1 hypothetical protein MQE35_08170 [Abyssalbus ytuae]